VPVITIVEDVAASAATIEAQACVGRSSPSGDAAKAAAFCAGLATLRDAVPEAASVATDPAAERHFVTKRAVAAVHLRATVRDHPFFFLGPCKGFA